MVTDPRASYTHDGRANRHTPVWPAVTALALIVVLLVLPSERALATALAAGAIVLFIARRGFSLTSPAWIVIGLLSATLVLGPIFWPVVSEAGGTGVPGIRYDAEVVTAAWNAIALVIAGIAVGATATSGARREADDRSISVSGVSRAGQSTIAVVVIVTFVVAIAFAGGGLWSRDSYLYLPFASPASLVSGTLSIPVVVMSGWLTAQRTNRTAVLAGWLGLGLAALLFFGLGSRSLGLVPPLALVGHQFAGRSRRVPVWLAVVVGLATLLLWQISLADRQAERHGVAPYAESLGPETAAELPAAIPTLSANFLVSYPIIGVTALAGEQRPDSHLRVSFDPRRGSAVGWTDMAPALRINAFTPYSAIGELAWYGRGVLLVYGLGIGGLLGVGERTLRRLPGLKGAILRLSLLASALLFGVTLLQYNLRASSRILYLAAAFVVIGAAVRSTRTARTTSTARTPRTSP